MSHPSYNTLRNHATRAFEYGGDYFHLSHISPFSPMNIFIASMNKGSVIGEMRWEIMGGMNFPRCP